MIGPAADAVQFVNSDTVLINEFEKDTTYYKILKSILKQNNLNYIILSPYMYTKSIFNLVRYIYFLWVGTSIFVPVFNIKKDVMSILFFENIFKGCNIISVDLKHVKLEGPILRSISWVVKLKNYFK